MIAPCGFSTECQTNGLRFQVPPGDELTIRIRLTSQHSIPPGELILMNYWHDNMKDRMVGVILSQYADRVFMATSAIGSALILLAACRFTNSKARDQRYIGGRVDRSGRLVPRTYRSCE